MVVRRFMEGQHRGCGRGARHRCLAPVPGARAGSRRVVSARVSQRTLIGMLIVVAALGAMSGPMAAQETGGGAGPVARGKVVVEHETGDVDLPAAAAPLVSIAGSVSDSGRGSALGDARIELLGVGRSFGTRSTSDGHFRLGAIPAGRYTLRITRLGYEPFVLEDIPVAGKPGQSALNVAMRQRTVALSEMVITPGQFGLLQRGVSGTQAMSRASLQSVPQLGEDIYRAVSRLPGVTTDDFSAKFGVRGASGNDLYVTLDGLELVEPFHMKDVGGAFSIIDIQTLGQASLNTGGFSAEYGDKLGGVFTLTTTDPSTEGVHGSVAVSAMNARATLQGQFAGGKGGWVLSARPGYLDFALKATEMRDSIQPRYYDLFAKATYGLAGGGRLAIHALRAGDTFKYLKRDEPNIFSGYGSSYAWATWDQPFLDTRLRMQSVVSASAISWQRHGENHLPDGEQTAMIDDARSLDRIGVRQDWTFDASRSVLFKWGFDAKRESAAYDYVRVMGVLQPDGTRTGRDDSLSTIVAPRADKLAFYFAPRVQLLRSLVVEAGARLDRSSLTDESIVSPRLNVSWQPLDRTTVRAAWGGYSQSQSLFSLQAEDGVKSFGRAERAEQRTLGVEQGLWNGVSARVEAYERLLTRARATYVNVGGDMWLFPELLWDRTLIDRTAGRDRGVELSLVRKEARRADWSVSYALASSMDQIAGAWVPRASDVRHTVQGDWSFHPVSGSWRLSVGGVWHSGWPYTPTVLHVDTTSASPTDLAITTWRTPGALNSMRLRPYQRVDVRWTKYFHPAVGQLSVFGEVYNLLGTVNARGFWRDAAVRDGQVVLTTGEIHQWPRLPVAGFSWQF